MKVSVLMAARDAEAFVAEAIGSVLAQTYEDWELLVLDDGSTDGTAAIAAGFGDSRIRVLRLERIGVLGQVRNRGLEAADGELVALLDADDAWRPEKLARQVALLRERPGVGLVHTGAVQLVDGRLHPSLPAPGGDPLARLVEDNFVYSSSVVIRRALLDEHGSFDPDPALFGSPDYELWLRLAPVTELAFLSEPLLVYRVHGGQMSARYERMCAGSLVALEKALARRPADFARLGPLLDRRLGMLRCQAALPGFGRRELLRALRRRPWDGPAWRWLARACARSLRAGARAGRAPSP